MANELKRGNGVYTHLKKNGEIIYVKIESNLINIKGKKVRIILATDVTEELKSTGITKRHQ